MEGQCPLCGSTLKSMTYTGIRGNQSCLDALRYHAPDGTCGAFSPPALSRTRCIWVTALTGCG